MSSCVFCSAYCLWHTLVHVSEEDLFDKNILLLEKQGLANRETSKQRPTKLCFLGSHSVYKAWVKKHRVFHCDWQPEIDCPLGAMTQHKPLASSPLAGKKLQGHAGMKKVEVLLTISQHFGESRSLSFDDVARGGWLRGALKMWPPLWFFSNSCRILYSFFFFFLLLETFLIFFFFWDVFHIP